MPSQNCAKMSAGCGKSSNTYHRCKKTIQLTGKQEEQVIKGGRIDGALFTDFCQGHVCKFCHKKFN